MDDGMAAVPCLPRGDRVVVGLSGKLEPLVALRTAIVSSSQHLSKIDQIIWAWPLTSVMLHWSNKSDDIGDRI